MSVLNQRRLTQRQREGASSPSTNERESSSSASISLKSDGQVFSDGKVVNHRPQPFGYESDDAGPPSVSFPSKLEKTSTASRATPRDLRNASARLGLDTNLTQVRHGTASPDRCSVPDNEPESHSTDRSRSTQKTDALQDLKERDGQDVYYQSRTMEMTDDSAMEVEGSYVNRLTRDSDDDKPSTPPLSMAVSTSTSFSCEQERGTSACQGLSSQIIHPVNFRPLEELHLQGGLVRTFDHLRTK